MLTADLVRAQCRGDRLVLTRPGKAAQQRLAEMAEVYVQLAGEHEGRPRVEFDVACKAAESGFRASDKKLAAGLKKLVLDRCEFEMPPEVDPPLLREKLFTRAAARRRQLGPAEELDRDALIAELAAELKLQPAQVEQGLYADLKDAQLLQRFDSLSAEALVERYTQAQAQAVLLKAVKVTVRLRDGHPAGYRRLFHALKFRRLLYRIEREDAGYRIELDGPMSLFSAGTKYGLQLALVLPVLDEVGAWVLDATVKWGRERQPLKFHLEGGAAARDAQHPATALADDVQALVERFDKLGSAWQVEPAEEILDLPGVGLCVPDLLFTQPASGRRVFLEVMGYWSRDAVWKRVELVQAGLEQQILFAVSERLRVSEAVLDSELPGALLVYKGVLNARSLRDRLEQLAEA